VSDLAQFDELAPLHPQVTARARATLQTRATRGVVVPARRRGHRTSEFWLVAAAIAGPVALALAGVGRRQVRDVAIGGGIAAAGYALGRSYVKGSLARRVSST
jgi:hypothetical protein